MLALGDERPISLRPVKSAAAADAASRFELKLDRRTRSRVARALVGGREVMAALTIVATDAAGNSSRLEVGIAPRRAPSR